MINFLAVADRRRFQSEAGTEQRTLSTREIDRSPQAQTLTRVPGPESATALLKGRTHHTGGERIGKAS